MTQLLDAIVDRYAAVVEATPPAVVAGSSSAAAAFALLRASRLAAGLRAPGRRLLALRSARSRRSAPTMSAASSAPRR